VSALGEAGVEAEHFLDLATSFTTSNQHSRATATIFLDNLLAFARRLPRVAAGLEIASQGYLSAVEDAFPGIRQAGAHAEVWWRDGAPFALPGEPLEMRLRRCGYALRHVASAHLASNVEAIAEQMALLQHALNTLPPAGVAPVTTLYAGLNELASQLEGYTVPNHIEDLSAQSPGLITGITQLHALDAREGPGIEMDIAWARAQYAFARSASLQSPDASWAHAALREWTATITFLEALPPAVPRVR
jgi:hypothetical protein